MPLAPGNRLEAYEILAPLGEGGMGQVYRARDTRLQRDVALKVLPGAFAADPERAARFDREAQALAALNHPNIAQIYDSGTVEDPSDRSAPGIVFLVMELVAGEDLSAAITRGAMPLADAMPIARQIALALEAAHAVGIIHRDLKPANVKVRPDGTVKVLDFGLAKTSDSTLQTGATMTSPAMTQQGIIIGTAAYMSPEQARGRVVDKRADIWAFGCVLYEMLTSTRPFGGDNVTDVIAAVVTGDPDWSRLPAETPRSIRRLLARCLQKDSRQRLHDVADARLEFEAPIEDDTPAAGAAGPAARMRGRWPTTVLVAAAVLALVAGTALGFAWRASGATPPPADWKSERLGGPSLAIRPRLSPDGHLLAFLAIADGLSQVSVMKPGTGAWTQLTRDRTHGLAFTLCWSTDGSHIYYDRITDAANGIYSVPALGGEERLVIENAQTPASLPDGSLLFARANANRILQLHRFWPTSGKLEPLPVAIQPDSMGPIRPLSGNRAVIHGRPLEAETDTSSLFIFDLASHDLSALGRSLPANLFSLAVDPRDQSVVVGTRDGSAYRVLRVSTDGKATLTPVLSLLERPDLDVAPDGALFVGLEARPVEVVQFTESGSDPQTISNDDTFQRGLAPLPDGRALVVSRIGSGPRVMVIAPGKDPVKLVETGESTRNPMSAVGTDRAALIIGPDDAPEIAIVAVNTGRILKRIKPQGVPNALDASPDGATLYVAVGGSISAIDIEKGDTRKIGAGDAVVVDPDNGDLIVRFDESTGYRLVRVPAKGGAPVPIAIKGDLRMVFYPPSPGSIRRGKMAMPVASADAWNWHVGVLDLARGDLRRVNVRPDLDFQYAAWTQDGRIIGYSAGTRAALWKFSR